MKKIALGIVCMFFLIVGFSQNSAVVSAYNYHKSGKLDKAKEYIDKATENEKTKDEAKTWFYRGNIYIDIYRSQDEKYKDLDPDALNKAYQAYKKAKELDDKNRYTDDINSFMPIVGEAYFNDGANKYNKGMTDINQKDSAAAQKDFTGSMNSFERAYQIYSEAGINDTTTIYYISVAAELAHDYDKAKTTLKKLIDMNYPRPSIYSSLGDIYYKQDKDVDKALEIYAKGRARYPGDLNLLLNETNIYLAEGMTQKALENLQQAAKIDTSNATIFFAIGAKYNEVADDTTKTMEVRQDAFEKAVQAYDRAIAIDTTYFDPNYNMGALYVNKASALIDEANTLPLEQQEKYQKLIDQANDYLKKSIPYLERARKIQPGDRSTLASLKEIYTRLNMNDKMKEIDALLKSTQ